MRATWCGADTTGIVILTQLRPISVFFSLPQQDLPDLTKGMAEGQLPIDALAPDGKTALDKGKVVVIDNQVDQTTGTVKIKAEFPNANLQLWPGQFVNVRVLIDTLRRVVVVPTAAIQRGPTRLRLRAQGRQHRHGAARDLTQQDDVQAVVATGLQAGERVVTTGFARLTEGRRSRPRARRTPARSRRAAAPPDGTRGTAGKGETDSGRGRTAGRIHERVSSPFIHRPIATSLLGVAVMLGGMLGYLWLPVSSLPQVDFPPSRSPQLPGASPDVMASLVTAPLERNFGQIPRCS